MGDGSSIQRNAPVDVVGLTTGVKAITAGGNHTCALTEPGGVKCWGNNSQGQLGNGRQTNSTIPLDVTGMTNNVVAIAAGVGSVRELELFVGAHHSCALTTAGNVKCWGDNSQGQLGNGTTTDSPLPVDVMTSWRDQPSIPGTYAQRYR